METHVAMQETHSSDLSLAWSCLRPENMGRNTVDFFFAVKPEVLNTYVTTIAIFLLKSVSEHSALRVSLAPFCDQHYRVTGPCLKRRKVLHLVPQTQVAGQDRVQRNPHL